jgi:hypothetical protein
MPEHVPLIFQIPGRLWLSAVVHGIKGCSTRLLNTLLARTGPFWLDESCGHVIRHQPEYEEKSGESRHNPAERGLVADSLDYRWLWIKERQAGKPVPLQHNPA